MNRLVTIALAAAAVLGVSACDRTERIVSAGEAAVQVIPASPQVVADRVTIDEEAGRLVTVAYTATSEAGALVIRARVAAGKPLDPATVRLIGDLDRRAYALVLATRQAYLSANASSYAKALKEAQAGIAQFLSAVKGARQ